MCVCVCAMVNQANSLHISPFCDYLECLLRSNISHSVPQALRLTILHVIKCLYVCVYVTTCSANREVSQQ